MVSRWGISETACGRGEDPDERTSYYIARGYAKRGLGTAAAAAEEELKKRFPNSVFIGMLKGSQPLAYDLILH